jgi:hypothetical protein
VRTEHRLEAYATLFFGQHEHEHEDDWNIGRKTYRGRISSLFRAG